MSKLSTHDFPSTQYQGTMLKNLIADATLAVARHAGETLCSHCSKPFNEHSHIGAFCPSPWPEPMHRKVFSPAICDHETPETVWGACNGEPCTQGAVKVVGDHALCAQHAKDFEQAWEESR